MEQWFYQLLGPGVPLICKQWNNGLTNFLGRGHEKIVNKETIKSSTFGAGGPIPPWTPRTLVLFQSVPGKARPPTRELLPRRRRPA